jgi:MoCo/4Fe-4S cofactor protein with predicted Tat translocation signal
MSFDCDPQNRLDLAAVRAKLQGSGGKRFWQSLEEVAGTKEYEKFLHNEFPNDPAKRGSELNRRDMLKVMGASAALAGLSACTKLPQAKIVPYVRPPEEIIPGKPLFYATSFPSQGAAAGLLVESHMGRPTKIEGNPEHPGSLGATDVYGQAEILNLYDPDRSRSVIHNGQISDWPSFVAQISDARIDFLGNKGAGLRLLTDTVISPSLGALIRSVLDEFPSAKWYQYEPVSRDAEREGIRLAVGRYLNPVYRFDQADIVVSLDSDFLLTGPGHVRYARDFSDKRRVKVPGDIMNRLYVVESSLTITGSMADHRLPLRPGEVGDFARSLAAALGVSAGGGAVANSKIPAKWISALAADLNRHRGSCLIIAGEGQPASIHALAHAMNAALGAAGKTVDYTEPIEVEPSNQLDGLRQLTEEMNAGSIELLLILGGNPVYNAPVDLNFNDALLKVKQRAHLASHEDETSYLCNWHVPQAHFLESWGDTRAYDGTVGVIQPLIAPLYDGKSCSDVLGILAGQAGLSDHDFVRSHWRGQYHNLSEKEFEDFWEVTLHNGVMAGTALPVVTAAAHPPAAGETSVPASSELELIFRPDPNIFDGRYANNGWLQEIHKPVSKVTWDNPVHVSPATADRLGVRSFDMVRITSGGRQIEAAVLIQPGQPDNTVLAHLGYGRSRAGEVGNGAGFNTYALRTSGAFWSSGDCKIERTGKTYELAMVQLHHIIDRNGQKEEEESETAFKRDAVRVATLQEFRENPQFAMDSPETDLDISLVPAYRYDGYAWGMSIDTNSCIGCNACVAACYSENNIAVVGKAQTSMGREMTWIRVDNYFRGDLENPENYFMPVPCMHCEDAPCELVCPVGATMHSPEGLNLMVYNRCVGTRYCSNNCPYKVRRFNFFLYSDYTTRSLFAMRNPNVTVRSRGVMEKCTYCIQRINAAKINAEEENREIREGEIVTACQAACPTQAIVFGNINDPNSRVAKLKAQVHNYPLYADLNTRPRTTYLARLRNPNPELI